MRLPWVRRSRLTKAERVRDIYKRRYDLVWRDHLARCGCHDSWDQCEHSASGHDAKVVASPAVIFPCGCCRFCSAGDEGDR